MNRISIPSEEIKSAGYDPQKKILEIELSSDNIIQYFNVPEKVFIGLLNANYYGTYYNDKIKNSYTFQRII
jgi:hypothetical protein